MPAANRRRRSRRRFITVTAFFLVAAVIAAAALWLLSPTAPQALPVVDLEGIDPAVRRVVEEARAAVLQKPQSSDAWGKLGMVLQGHGLSVEASNTCFRQAERLDPLQPRWPYFQGHALLLTDPEAAILKLKRAADLSGGKPDVARLQLAEQLLDLRRFQEAADEFLRVLQQNPSNARASLGLARLAFERDDLSECTTCLNRCVDDIHTRKAACSLLAQAYQRLGNKASAEQELRQAAELPDDTPWPNPFLDEIVRLRVGKRAILSGADQLLHQNRFPQALKVLELAVKDYPNEEWAWEMLGRAYLGLRDLPAAERSLRRATELRPNMPEAQFYLGVALILQKNPQAAASCFRRAAELKPGYALAYYNLGHSLKEQGDDAGAVAAFRMAINCKPDDSASHYNLAALLLKKGQRESAAVHLRHAVEFDPTNQKAKELLEQVLK
jgi:tetratricopeptide (TPR) repeat protein